MMRFYMYKDILKCQLDPWYETTWNNPELKTLLLALLLLKGFNFAIYCRSSESNSRSTHQESRLENTAPSADRLILIFTPCYRCQHREYLTTPN